VKDLRRIRRSRRQLEQNQARLEEDLRELDALGFFERTIGGDGEGRWALHGGGGARRGGIAAASVSFERPVDAGGSPMLGAALVIGFLILVGPLSLLYGADSRVTRDHDRGWWPATPRK
jgi:hypothetical protein